MLRIGRHEFEIAETEFRAYVSIGNNGWRVSWNLEVIGQPRELDDLDWAPKLRSHLPLEGLLSPDRLSGTRIGPLPNDESGEPVFLLYVFEHEAVIDPILSFGERRGIEFPLTLTGKTPNWDEQSSETEVAVVLDCWVAFGGVVVDEFKAEKARQRLVQFFPPTGWSEPRLENTHQVFSWLGEPPSVSPG
jgi:hypothetical protein